MAGNVRTKQVMSHAVSDEEQLRHIVDKIPSATPCSTVVTTSLVPTSSKASIFSNSINCGLPIDKQNITQKTRFGETLLKTLDTPLFGQKLTPRVFSHSSTASAEQSNNKAKILKEESTPDVSTRSILPDAYQVVEKTPFSKIMTIDLTKSSIFPSQPKVGIELISLDQKGSSKMSSFRSDLLNSISSKAKPLLAVSNSQTASTSTQSSSATPLNNPDTVKGSRHGTRLKKSPYKSHPYRKKHDILDTTNSNPKTRSAKSTIATASSFLALCIQPESSRVDNHSHTKNILTEEIVDQPSSQTLPTDNVSLSRSQQPSGGELTKSKPVDELSVPYLSTKEVIESPIRKDCVTKEMVDSHFDGHSQTLIGKDQHVHLPVSVNCILKELDDLHSASVERVQPLHQEDKIQSRLGHKSKQALGTTSHELPTRKETNSQTTQVIDLTSEPLPTECPLDFVNSTKATSISSIGLKARSDTRLKQAAQISQRSQPYRRKPKEEKVNQLSTFNHILNKEQSLVTASYVQSRPLPAKQNILPHRELNLMLTKKAVNSPLDANVHRLPAEGVISILPDSCAQTLLSTNVTQPPLRPELISEAVILPFSDRHHLEIFNSHPRVVQHFASMTSGVSTKMSSSDDGHPLVVISGIQADVISAKEQVQCFTKEIADKTVTKCVSCQYKAIPLICSHPALQSLLKCQQDNCLDITFARKYDCPLRLHEFFNLIVNRPEHEVLKTNDFQHFLHRGSEKLSDFCWESTNDDGVFFAVCSEFDSILKCHYTFSATSGIQGRQFSYNGDFYTVDFAEGLLLENLSGQCRRIRKGLPYWHIWSNEEGRFVRHAHSEDIEHFFQFGGMHLDAADSKYTFSFQNSQFSQIDIKTGTELPLQRYPSLFPFPPDFEITISITGLSIDVDFVESTIMKLSKETTTKHELQFVIPSNTTIDEDKLSAMIQAQIMNVTKQFFVSVQLSVMGDNKIRVMLEGAPEYVQNVYHLLSKLTFESQQDLLESMTMHRSSAPRMWDSQVETCTIKRVSEVSQEWNDIHNLMKETLPDVRIQNIERIQNKPLWEKYSIERKHMIERNGEDNVNELRLFHGSGKADPRDIAKSSKGIDFRYSSNDRKLMWGTGAYFAVNASYSNNYAHSLSGHHKGLKEIILVGVLTGKSCNSEPNDRLRMPPLLTSSSSGGERYDTVNGETGGSKVYIVYDHDRSYPAYIITYYEK